MNTLKGISKVVRPSVMTFVVSGAETWILLRNWLRKKLPKLEPRLVCMVFHDIQPDQEAAFRAQLEKLRAHFEIVDLPEFGRRLRGERQNTRDALLLTFDDAYVSSLRVGEILSEYGLRGVFFVPTGFIDCQSRSEQEDYVLRHLFYGVNLPEKLPAGVAPLTWEELRGLVARGHHIGCHTRSHPPLHILNTAEKQERELIESCRLIETRLGCRVEAFAVPFGNVESFSSGPFISLFGHYRYIFTSVRGNNRGRHHKLLLRETVLPTDTPDNVLFQAVGGLGWAYWNARRKLQRLTPG